MTVAEKWTGKAANPQEQDNRLLASLSPASLERVAPALESVPLRPRHVVHRRNARLTHAYFPCGGLVSVVMQSNGDSVEVAMVGNEGLFGLSLLFGADRCPMTALAQVGGPAVRLEAGLFRELLQEDKPFADTVGRYAHAYTVMIAQGAVCNSSHKLERRCARWLLMAHDRVRQDEFPLTQAFLAQMLSVRRSTVSEVAEKMRANGLIGYRQGRVRILNRRGLEELACGCYGIIRGEFRRMGLDTGLARGAKAL